MVEPACVCMCVWGRYNNSLFHPILGDSKFVILLKTVLTFNHSTNDAIVSKIGHIFYTKLCAVDGSNKKISPKIT